MLTILKEEPNDNLNAFLNKLNVKTDLQGKIVMAAKNGEKYLGVGALELRVDKVYLNFLITEDDDLILKLSIIKSLLNLADLRGIKVVYGDNSELASCYKMARFKETDGEFCADLSDYFTCCG